MEEIAAVGPVATSHINFRGVLHFPIEEFSEPILRVPGCCPSSMMKTHRRWDKRYFLHEYVTIPDMEGSEYSPSSSYPWRRVRLATVAIPHYRPTVVSTVNCREERFCEKFIALSQTLLAKNNPSERS